MQYLLMRLEAYPQYRPFLARFAETKDRTCLLAMCDAIEEDGQLSTLAIALRNAIINNSGA